MAKASSTTSMTSTSELDDALEELCFTLEQIRLSSTRPTRPADELRAFVNEIDEDLAALETACAHVEEVPAAVKEARKDATRTKRLLIREAINLDYDAKQAAASASPISGPSHTAPKTKVKLKPVDVPSFDGDATKYRLFRNAYTENIEENSDLTTTSKWIYLRRSLSGPPAEMITNMPETAKNLQDALKLLDTTYGNPKRVIQHLFQEIYKIPIATLKNENLRLTQGKLESLLCSLENAGHPVNTDLHLQFLVMGKFPPDIIYQLSQGETLELSSLRTKLNTFIASRENVMTQMLQFPTSNSSSGSSGTTAKNTQHPARAATQRPVQCLFCKGLHWSDECTVYPTVEERIKQIPDKCPRCLRTQHTGPCGSERRCVYCDEMTHNRALCPKKFNKQPTLYAIENVSQRPAEGAFWTFCLYVGSTKTPEKFLIHAVIDSGGAKTIVSDKLATLLHLTANKTAPMQMQSLGNTELPPAAQASEHLILYPADSDSISLPVYITTTIADDLPAPSIEKFRAQHPEQGHRHIPATGAGQPVDLLFGKNALIQILTLAKSQTVSDRYQLLSTKFGYIIVSLEEENLHQKPQKQLSFLTELTQEIPKLWDLEDLGLKFAENKDVDNETKALEKFYRSIEFKNGRYHVGLPYVHNPPLLDENFGLAWGRLQSLWHKLKTHPELLLAYHDIILKQYEENKIEQTARRGQEENAVVHYIPHHPVIRPDSASTKIRIVYDASARTSKQQRSLNENLHKGTPWVEDMFAILQRFRRYHTALTADIAQAFLQIGIQEQDRDAVRFLRLRNPLQAPAAENLITYRFTRIAFGIISSPFLLRATIEHHLKTVKHPRTEQILQDLYADNIVASLPPHMSARQYFIDIKAVFKEMSMNMTKWVTNSTDLLEIIPTEDQQPEIIQTVLGLLWHTKEDTLQLKPVSQNFNLTLPHTKRRILQDTARIFDPLGYAAPILLFAKVFLRKLWHQKLKWDDHLPTALAQEWTEILNKLRDIDLIKISRSLLPDTSESVPPLELHTFVDASIEACAIVVYARLKYDTNSSCTLLAAKTKLTPQNTLSIPRLELLALVLGIRFQQYTRQKLCWPALVTTYIWSDSKCALAWASTNKILPATVQKQITEIRQHRKIELRYVPSALNPADVATRGGTYEELQQAQWWTGPPWLHTDEAWPPVPPTEEDIVFHASLFLTNQPAEPEQRAPLTTKGVCNLDLVDFSSLSRLLKRTAYCIRAINLLLKRVVVPTEMDIDYTTALRLWLRFMQQQAYPEIHDIKLKKKHTLRNIRVSLDEHDLIRCQSRMKFAALEPTAKFPILLAKKHRLTELIVLQTHQTHGHVGTAQTLALLRQSYWLPQGRRTIFHIIQNQCYQCRRHDPKRFAPPQPAPLPEFRVTQLTRPFEAVGMDVFGPIKTRKIQSERPNTIKRWVVIFTCTTTRAISLELLYNLNTKNLLEALRRFAARRGTPRLIVCDNAPQFRVIQNRLSNLWQTFSTSADASTYFAQKSITWKFLPPHVPWMGGHYERLIASIKQAMRRTYGNAILTDRQLDTSLLEIEAILNSRPLTYVDQHIDSVIVTPNHFLQVQYPAIPLNLDRELQPNSLLTLWKAAQRYIEVFWQHWSQSFLLALRDRDDKIKKKNNLSPSEPAVNDIVVITEPPLQRSSWKLARVEHILLSEDGRVRTVQLILGNRSRLVRPILLLAPLRLTADLPPATQPLTANRDAIIVDKQPFNPPEPPVDEVVEIELDLDWSDDETTHSTCNRKTSQGTESTNAINPQM